jgi:hypothetical protein
MKTPRGASLIELLTVMSACTVLLSISAGLVHRAMFSHSHTRSFFDVERSALRLSGQFRRDVHQANPGEMETAAGGEAAFLRLKLPDEQTVEYRRAEKSVFRVLSRNGQTVSREEFPFRAVIDVSLREEESPRRLVLSIIGGPATAVSTSTGTRASAKFRDLPVSFQAEAVLGRNRRFAEHAAPEEKAI